MQHISLRSGAVVAPSMRTWLAALWLALLPLLAVASGPARLLRPAAAPPTLSTINPPSGPTGTSLTLTGSNLSPVTAITFTSGGGTATNAANTYTAGSTSVTGVVVPAGLSLGAYTVTATNQYGTSNGVPFTVTVAPFGVSSFAPASGAAGTSVTITGNQLDLATGVRFGTGTLTTNFVSQSATSLTVLVPVVSSTGVITVTSSAGASVSSATAFTYVARQNLVAILSPAGPLDVCQPRTLTASAAFPAFTQTGTGFSSFVQSVVVQTDGKVLVGGGFTTYNGAAAPYLVRLNVDGTRDASFAQTGTGLNSSVNSMAVQADGKVLVSGGFTTYNGAAAPYLMRLNADGTRDATFAQTGTGLNSSVNSMVLQANGKVLVGGFFSTYNGVVANRLMRLNADGTRDATFAQTGTGLDNPVQSVAVQADGKLVVGGQFTTYNGVATPYLVRLNADGSRDATFAQTGSGLNAIVNSVVVQADGKLVVGGQFTTYNGVAAPYLVRLNADGSRDATFAQTGSGLNAIVYSVAVQADGKVLVGGFFSTYSGVAAPYLVRLNADGSRDATFVQTGSGLNTTVRSVAVQTDSKVLVGGSFTTYNGAAAPYLVRLNADGSPNTTATTVVTTRTSFTFSPGNTTTNPLVASTTGSYAVTAIYSGETSGLSNTVVLTACPVPAISGFTPTSGPAGTSVTLTGTDLDKVSGLRFGTGVLTANFVSQSATSLTVLVPVVSSTGVLTLTNGAGASVSSSSPFTYTPRPGGLVATLAPAGPLDVCQPRTLTASAASPAFVQTGTGLNNTVYNVAVQADGKVLVGGSFTTYNGVAAPYLMRLNADGSRDATFAQTGTGFNNSVESMAVQADGKVLVGGVFSTYDGVAASRIVRLNADGSRDATFATGTGLNGTVNSVVVQADGKVLVGGQFTTYNGAAANNLVRLNADGSRDATFVQIGTGLNGTVNSVAVQTDGKVLVGGFFTNYYNTTVSYLVRLNPDGVPDPTFATGTGFNTEVYSVVVQADGKVLVSGRFSAYNGVADNNLVRLNANGSRDATFVQPGTGIGNFVRTVAVQADGKVLAGGQFTSYNGVTGTNRLVRLNADGSRDTGFVQTGTGFNGTVYSVAVQADGKVLAGGIFTTYNGTAAPYLARLNADGTRNDTATPVSGASFTFSPGGTTTNPLVTSTAGSYSATASLNGETSAASNTVVLTACPVPVLSSISPTSGVVGASVTLTGSNLTGATAVTFGGTSNNTVTTGLTVSGSGSAQTITVTVPSGATTGNVTVTTSGGTSNGVTFTVTPAAPAISGAADNPVAVGGLVALTGTGLAGATGVTLSSAAFGTDILTTFTSNTATTLAFALPLTGYLPGFLTSPGVYAVTVTTPNGTSAPFNLTVTDDVAWTGASSTAWATATNWSPPAVPNLYLNTTINPAANQPTVTGIQEVQSLRVTNAAALTLAPAADLTIDGSVTLAAGSALTQGAASELYIGRDLTHNGATLTLEPTSEVGFGVTATDHTIGGSTGLTLQILTVGERADGSSSFDHLHLAVPVAVARKLEIVNNAEVDNTGGSLTLLSTPAHTALVVQDANSYVDGRVTVQRAVTGPYLGAGYRHYSAPMSDATVATLATPGFAPVVGGAYNASPTPGRVMPFPTVFGYDESRVAPATSNLSGFDKGWYTPAATTAALTPGQGYTVQIAGSQTVAFQGTLNRSDLTLPLARSTGADAGWHLLGNPYPAPLDYSLVDPADRSGLDAAMYVFAPSGPYAGSYRAYLPPTGGNPGLGSSVLALGQGFFVRVSPAPGSGSFTFRNAQRVTDETVGTTFSRSTATTTTDPRPLLTLALASATGGPADALTVYATAGATTGIEGIYDAVKLPNPSGLNLASLAATGEALTIDGRATLAGAVPLQVGLPAAGTYTLTAATVANLAGTRAELVDNLTGTRTLLVAGAAYTFTSATTTAPGRFWLNLTPTAAPLATAAALEAQVLAYPNPTHGTLTVLRPVGEATSAVLYNALGQVVRTVALPTAETTFTLAGLPAGVYALRLTVAGHALTRRVVLD